MPEQTPDTAEQPANIPDQHHTFRRQLGALLNTHSKENGSDTPDWILADYLVDCLNVLDKAVSAREKWYARSKPPNIIPPEITLAKARGAAARVWCDKNISSYSMDVDKCEEIARILIAMMVEQNAEGATQPA